MASKNITVPVTSGLTEVRIETTDPPQLYVEGVLTIPDGDGGTAIVKTYTENVTALLGAEDIAAAVRLITRAQAWIDAKLP